MNHPWMRSAGEHDPDYYLDLTPWPDTCLVCGLTYCATSPDDRKLHSRHHTKVISVLMPKPLPQISEMRSAGKDPEIVIASSPQWAQKEMYKRALRFCKETRWGVMWSVIGERGDDVAGHFLFDDSGLYHPDAIIGAATFRYREYKDALPRWALQWIWITPKMRHKGVLTRYWPKFTRIYGAFEVERPLTEGMKAALAKLAPPTISI